MNGYTVHALVEDMTERRVVELLREMDSALFDSVVNGRELVKHGILTKAELEELASIKLRTEIALHRRDIDEKART